VLLPPKAGRGVTRLIQHKKRVSGELDAIALKSHRKKKSGEKGTRFPHLLGEGRGKTNSYINIRTGTKQRGRKIGPRYLLAMKKKRVAVLNDT